jgi:hypothetical protein
MRESDEFIDLVTQGGASAFAALRRDKPLALGCTLAALQAAEFWTLSLHDSQ